MSGRSRPVALVTGAGRGLGGEAVALARRGYDVVVNERSAADETAGVAAEVEAAGGRAAVVHGDVADLAGHGRLLVEAWAAFGGVDGLVNNAGVTVLSRGDLLDVAPESFDRCLAVNTRGAFFLTQAFARRLLAEAGGAVRARCGVRDLDERRGAGAEPGGILRLQGRGGDGGAAIRGAAGTARDRGLRTSGPGSSGPR